MPVFLVLLLVSLVIAIGLACAINFFFQPGPWRAFGYGLFITAIFLIFCASGLWDGASKYAWGPLTPVFVIMLMGGWASIRFGKKGWEWLKRKRQK